MIHILNEEILKSNSSFNNEIGLRVKEDIANISYDDDKKLLNIDLSDIKEWKIGNIINGVETIIKEILAHKRTLVVYRFEKEKIDYELNKVVISELELTNIKKRIKKEERERERKDREDFLLHMKKKRDIHIKELENKKGNLSKENDDLKTKLESEIIESKKLNDEINIKYKEMSDIKEKLKMLADLKEKIEKSKKEVNKVISKEKNRNVYLDEMKRKGFILSYAGCLKIALKQDLSVKDIIKNQSKSDLDKIIEFVEEQEKNCKEKIKKFMIDESDDDEELVDDDFDDE